MAIQRIKNSIFFRHLMETFSMFVFVLLLQMLLSIHLLMDSPFASFGVMTSLPFFVKCTIRSILWCSLSWFLVALVRKGYIRQILTIIFFAFFIFLHFLESYLLSQQGVPYSFSIVSIFAATTPSESAEYLTSLNIGVFIRPLIEIFLVGGTCWLIGQFRIEGIKLKRVTFKGLIIVSISALLVSAYDVVFSMPRTYDRIKHFGIPMDYTLSPVDRLIWNTYAYQREVGAISEKRNELAKIDLGTLDVQKPYGPINVVVVIGESLRRQYMHLYGYPLSNTPHLDSLTQTKDLITFSNVTSPSTATMESLQRVLSLQQVDSSDPWYKYPALTNILSRSGYLTYWTSNQDNVGVGMQSINVIAHFSDSIKYIQTRAIDADNVLSTSRISYDSEVLEFLHERDTIRNKSAAQFVHLIGCHMDYNKRYPKGYTRFNAKDIESIGGHGDKQNIADYVNSIYYNDDVVYKIIQKYSNSPSLVVYFSDHGEALYDIEGKSDFYGHGVADKSNVEIPFMVYVSPQLRGKAPELYQKIQQAKDRPIVNDLFTNSLLELLGIRTKYSNPKLEFFSSEYDSTRPRIATSMGQIFHP